MDELRLLSITSKIGLASGVGMVDAGDPYPEKMAVAQSKNRDEKKRGHRLPGAAFWKGKVKPSGRRPAAPA